MSCDGSKSEFLAARETRQEAVDGAAAPGMATLLVSLNVPGPDKEPPGVEDLFAWALRCVATTAPEATRIDGGTDRLGPWALLTAPVDAWTLKERCLAIEEEADEGRLLDLDVYDEAGQPVSRRDFGRPLRPCLVCQAPAVDCIRVGRHDAHGLRRAVAVLLAPFQP